MTSSTSSLGTSRVSVPIPMTSVREEVPLLPPSASASSCWPSGRRRAAPEMSPSIKRRCTSTQKMRPGTCSRERWRSAPADTSTRIPAGGAVIVPGRTAHTFWNPRPDPARYLLIMGARTYALIQAIHATDDRSPARMRQLYAAHGATLLD